MTIVTNSCDIDSVAWPASPSAIAHYFRGRGRPRHTGKHLATEIRILAVGEEETSFLREAGLSGGEMFYHQRSSA